MSGRTLRGFQPGAFQSNAFQMPDRVGSGWIWWDALRARAAAERRRKRKEEQREPEPVLAYAEIIPRARLSIVARPRYTDLTALAASMTPPGRDRDLEEFRAFMQMVADMEEI